MRLSWAYFIAFVIIMLRKAARELASFDPPMPFIDWREELREMAVSLPARLA
jgi:hypothetical protein